MKLGKIKSLIQKISNGLPFQAIKAKFDEIKVEIENTINEAVRLALVRGYSYAVQYEIKQYRKLRKGESGVNVGLLIGLFIFILVGIVLLPVITSEVNSLTSGSSPQVTGTDATLLNLVPLFYTLVLIIVPAVIAYKMYKE